MVSNNKPNIINLTRDSDAELHVDFTKEMLPVNGRYIMQFEYTDGNVVGHTDKFDAFVNDVINTEDTWVDIPSEFEQLRQEIMQNAIIAQNAANEAKKISQEIKVESDKAVQAAKDAQQYAQQAQQAVDLAQEAQRLAQEANQAAQEAKNQAVLSATEAEQSATQASQSKTEAAESATQANQAKVEAEESATQASQSATQANLSKDEAKKAQLASEKARDESQAILEQIQSIKVEVDGIVAQINDARDKALQAIETNKNSAVESVNNAGTNNVANVNQAGATQVKAVNDTGVEQVQAVTNEGNKQVGLVTSEGTKQVQAVTTEGTNQLQSIRNEGSKQVQSITTEGTTQVKNVSDEGGKQVQAVTAQGETQTNLVVAEGTKQVGLVNTAGQEQVKAVNDAGAIQTANAKEQADRAKTEADRAEKAADGVQDIASSIDRLAIHETAEGNPVTIKDSADWQMEGLRVYGQSEQVTTTGAQLFNDKTIVNGFILINGDLANPTNAILNERTSDFILLAKSTRVSVTAMGTPSKDEVLWVAISFYKNDKTFIKRDDSFGGTNAKESKLTVNIPAEAVYARLSYRKYNDVVVMFNEGSTAKPYEPYTGGKPSPSPEYPQEIMSREVAGIVVTGSNLIPPDDCEKTQTNVYLGKNQGIYLYAGVKYVFSCDGGNTNLYSYEYKSQTNISKGYNTVKLEFTPSENGLYYFGIFNEGGITQFTNFRLNVGIKMPYEPYHAQTVKLSAPVTLRGVPVKTGGNVTINGQRYMADRITERDGVIGVERRIADVDLKRLAYFKSNRLASVGGHYFISRIATPIASGGLSVGTMCNILPCKNPYDNAGDNIWAHTAGASNEVRLGLADQSIDTKEKLLELLNSLPEAHAIFAMANTAFETLPETDQQAIRELRTYRGNTVVTTGAWTETDYVADPKLYIDNKIKELSAAIVAR